MFKKHNLTLLALFILVVTSMNFGQITINHSGSYATIQAAVNAAHDGDRIDVPNGTYVLTSTLNLNHELTIVGQSESGVIINASAVTSWGINPNKSNTTLSYMTIIPNGTTTGGYPIHVSSNATPFTVISNVTLSHITINGAMKTAFDCNAVDNLTLEYLTANNTVSGNGVQVSGCTNVTAHNIYTSNNAWGGMAVYVSTDANRGSNNVTIDGPTTNVQESCKIYVQNQNGLSSTNITVLGFDYTIQNPISFAGYTFYQSDQTSALAFASALPSPGDSYVKQVSNGQFWVSPTLKIQTAINTATPGATINAIAGMYHEEVNVNKTVSLKGAGIDVSIIEGPKTGAGQTIMLGANNILLDGFTITRAGNTVAEWSSNAKVIGIAFKQLSTGITVQNCKTTGNFNGIYLNNSQGQTIKNNIITNNRNGIQLVNNVSNCLIEQNEITDNWTVGVVLYCQSAGQPASTNVVIKNNNISGNWYSQVESKTIQANATTMYDLSGNWFGSATPNVTNTLAGEPDYPVQIPVGFGGTAVSPGTNSGKISGDLVAKIKYSPWLSTGTDIAPGTLGFQGDFSHVAMNVTSPGGTNIQTVLDLVPPSGIFTLPGGGTEYDHLTINHPVTLQSADGNAIINGASPAITVNSTNVTITGFIFNDVPASDYAIDVLNGPYNVNINSCSFLTSKGVRNQGTGIVDARNNWWGSTFGPKNLTSNPGGSGSEISDNVLYNPWKMSAPTLDSPANTVTGVSILPNFSWIWPYTGDNIKYEIKIYDSNSATLLINITGITEKSYQLKETDYILLNNHTYYWTVTVWSGAYCISSPSTASSFKTTLPAVATLSNPGNGATVYTYAPVLFTWTLNQVVGSLIFDVQYMKHTSIISGNSTPNATDWAQGGSIVKTGNAGSDITLNTETLESGTKYWWRVVTKMGTNVVSYSSSRSFTTSGGVALAHAIPTWPTGGNKVYTNSPTCYWYTNGSDLTDISFDLVVSNNPTFLSNGLNNTYTYHSSDLYADVTANLDPGVTYYWKVKTYYKYEGPGSFSQQYDPPAYQATFKTNGTGTLLTPVLSYPKGGITLYTTTPVLYWYLGGSSDGLNFDIIINNHTYHTTDLYLDLSNVETSAGLVGGGTYSWTVTANNGSGNHLASTSGTFKVAGGVAQGKPIASWPVGNPTVYETSPTLYWYVSGSTLGISGLTVAWTTIDPTTHGFFWESSSGVERRPISDLTQTNYTLDATLIYGQKYYWAVASYNGSDDYSVWSTGSFTMVGTLGSIVPVISYPKGGVTISSTSAVLSWFVNGSTAGIQGYELVYSTRADMDETDQINTTVVGGSGSYITDQFYSVSDLVPGATYYWKVKSFNGSHLSNPSATGVFSVTASANSAIVPRIGSPNNGVPLDTDSPMLTWALPTMPNAQLTFELQYSTQQDFSSAATVTDIKDPSKIISDLKSGQAYYWRVRSVTDKGQSSAYSETGKFVVNSITGVEEKGKIPTQFDLDQNYPNPFNPSTVIQFGLPTDAFVTLKIYNILGQEVRTLISDMRSAGTYNVQWNGQDNSGSQVQSGTYIYRVVAGDYISAKKMVLIK